MKFSKAIFAAGCFWGIEEIFSKTKGVKSTRVGYTGGDFKNPTYEDVLSHKTGHTEAVEVTFDPKEISYKELLAVFWKIHNPTTKNRQGPDVGSNYRAAIFYLDDEQKKEALKSKEALISAGKYKKGEIVTEIAPLKKFWEAEKYHQQYFLKHPEHGCPIEI